MFWNLSRVKAGLYYRRVRCVAALGVGYAHEIYVWGGDPTIIIIIFMYHNARTKDNLCASRSCAVRNSAAGQKSRKPVNNGVTSYAAADYFNPLVLAAQQSPDATRAFTSISSFFTYNTFSSIIIRRSVHVSLFLAPSQSHSDRPSGRLLANRSDRLCLHIYNII